MGNKGVKQLCNLFCCCMSHFSFLLFQNKIVILNFYFIPNFCIRPTITDMDRKPLEFWGSALRYVLAASCHILSVTVMLGHLRLYSWFFFFGPGEEEIYSKTAELSSRESWTSCARIITLLGGRENAAITMVWKKLFIE